MKIAMGVQQICSVSCELAHVEMIQTIITCNTITQHTITSNTITQQQNILQE